MLDEICSDKAYEKNSETTFGASEKFGFYRLTCGCGTCAFKAAKDTLRFGLLTVVGSPILLNRCDSVISVGTNAAVVIDPYEQFRISFKSFSQIYIFLAATNELRSQTGYVPQKLWDLRLNANTPLGMVSTSLLKSISHYVENLHTLEIDALGLSELYAASAWISSTRRRMKGITAQVPATELLRQRAESILLEEMADPALDLGQVAKRLEVSTRYLTSCFRLVGQSVMDRLKELRLNAAAEKLSQHRHRNRPVAQIAADCGFNSAEHFSREFKKKFGVTPSEWKKTSQLLP